MAYSKRILCLANSYKTGGRCIAGREVIQNSFSGWIRPVSDRPHHEINGLEMRYRNGGSASVLDYMDITFQSPQPHHFQTENHLINAVRWSHAGTANWAVLQNAVDTFAGPLWRNGESTYHGQNDKIQENLANQIQSSLTLIRPENASICVEDEHQYMGGYKRAVRAHFDYSDFSYIIKVTDPVALEKYKPLEAGDYPLDDTLFCLSLGETYQGYAFKLVAAIFTPDM